MINPLEDHKKWVMYPGRWQPFHNGHLAIINKSIEEGKNVWIAIRDTKLSASDPYTTTQRIEMIKRAFGHLYGSRVIASIIPDIEGIRYSRGVGYFIEEIQVPKDIAEISATNIRKGVENRLNDEVANYLNLLQSTIWFTGLPCSGKSTLADKLKEEMDDKTGYHPIRLDGDDIRGKGKLNEDLGFSDRDRLENLRRVSHLSRIHNENKSTVLATFVSPTEELRGYIKNIIGPERFKLIYVKCPLEVCEQRDVKGMYKKARAGEIKEFTGISAPFEEPVNADVVVDTSKYDIRECLNKISSELKL